MTNIKEQTIPTAYSREVNVESTLKYMGEVITFLVLGNALAVTDRLGPRSRLTRWDEKAGLQRDAIRSQCSTCSRHKKGDRR